MASELTDRLFPDYHKNQVSRQEDAPEPQMAFMRTKSKKTLMKKEPTPMPARKLTKAMGFESPSDIANRQAEQIKSERKLETVENKQED